jgi:hypothetical protein
VKNDLHSWAFVMRRQALAVLAEASGLQAPAQALVPKARLTASTAE